MMIRFIFIALTAIFTSGCALLVTEGHAVQAVSKSHLSTKRATFDCRAMNEKDPAGITQMFVDKQQLGWKKGGGGIKF